MCFFINRLSQEQHNKWISKRGNLKRKFIVFVKRCGAKKSYSGFRFVIYNKYR